MCPGGLGVGRQGGDVGRIDCLYVRLEVGVGGRVSTSVYGGEEEFGFEVDSVPWKDGGVPDGVGVGFLLVNWLGVLRSLTMGALLLLELGG